LTLEPPPNANDQPLKNVFATAGVGRKKESAVLLGVLVRGDLRREFTNPLEELELLSNTAGIAVFDKVVQRLDRPNPATYCGSGTVEKVKQLAEETGADTIICDNDLSPAQLRNLEKICKLKVVDRTDLILDIFARHAKTNQARLQVELAQLEYARPRLRKMWSHLEGEQGGVGFRGPGEKQLEMDKRMLGKRVKDLKGRLKDIRERKVREVSTRSQIHTVALVGYTNAGKSTLFGRLTDSDPYIADKLFATLDTKTRPFQVKTRLKGVLSDTVGFIDHLPHRLVESFHATLEEVLQADLLVHVVDVSGDDPLRQVEAVDTVLKQVGCVDRPMIMALNKVDLADPAMLPFFIKRLPRSVPISAKSGAGVDQLREAIADELTKNDRPCRVSSPMSEGRFIAALEARASALTRKFKGQRLVIDMTISEDFLNQALRMSNDRQSIKVKWLSKSNPK
jgi:GTPase